MAEVIAVMAALAARLTAAATQTGKNSPVIWSSSSSLSSMPTGRSGVFA
jgi:hypothetical protein